MGELLMRRREMIMPGVTPSEWDSDWEYTNGAPTVEGWVQSGDGSVTMRATGYYVRGPLFDKEVSVSHGILEAKFQVVNERTNLAGQRARLRIGNSDNAINLLFNGYSSRYRIYLNNYSADLNASTVEKGTLLGIFELGGEYTVKITIDGSVGAVEVNGVMLKDNIDTAKMYNKGGMQFGGGSSYYGSTWQYVKYKSFD